jgi:hypothetical protein
MNKEVQSKMIAMLIVLVTATGFVWGGWNWLAVSIFGFPEITFWEAWGFVLISSILVMFYSLLAKSV